MARNGRKSKIILTRNHDHNLSGRDRANVSGKNGADVFLGIHFNDADDATIRGSEIWIYPGSPPPSGYTNNGYDAIHQINHDDDFACADRLLDSVVHSIPGGFRRAEGVKEYSLNSRTHYAPIPSDIVRDHLHLLNERIDGRAPETISRAALIEVEYISRPDADNWFNGADGSMHVKNPGVGMARAINQDILIQP